MSRCSYCKAIYRPHAPGCPRDPATPRTRTFAFDDRRLTRPQIVDTIAAALDDEGLRLSQGSWGRVTIAIKDGRLIAAVPSSAITSR